MLERREFNKAISERPLLLREILQQAFALLKEGGHVKMEIRELPWSPCAASVTDRFGVNWFLSLPNHRPPEDFQPGDEI